MFRVQIDINPSLENLGSDLEKFSRISDSQLMSIADGVKEFIESNIARGMTWEGSPVQPLALSTIKRKHSSQPLVQTGLLLSSIGVKKAGADAYDVYVVGKRNDIVGYLVEGTSHILARPFFGVSDSAFSTIVDNVLGKENNE